MDRVTAPGDSLLTTVAKNYLNIIDDIGVWCPLPLRSLGLVRGADGRSEGAPTAARAERERERLDETLDGTYLLALCSDHLI